MAKTEIITSFETASQIPLDAKLVVATLDDLRYLGDDNVKASKYYKNMKVNCLEDNKTYVWREELYTDEPKGLLVNGSYTYPTGSITTEPLFDYSGKKFNFFLEGSFDDDFAARLRELVYKEAVTTLTPNKNTLEKGLETQVIFSWSFTANDDTFISFTFDGASVPSTSQAFNLSNTSTKTLIYTVFRTKDLSQPAETVNISRLATVNFYAPQFIGKTSSDLDANTYTLADFASATKVISSSTTQIFNSSLSDEYFYFVLNSSSKASFTDLKTNFNLTVGAWGSGEAIWKKTITLTLADGSSQSTTLYRAKSKSSTTPNIRS